MDVVAAAVNVVPTSNGWVAVRMAATLEVMSFQALTFASWAVARDCASCMGRRSSAINWLMMALVSSPLLMPSMDAMEGGFLYGWGCPARRRQAPGRVPRA
ncbi:MAG: hypothetical protein MUE34_01105 [Acidimicrobiales bacterium]|nr:hypothetical protein [Acidimicrobiales bacterium]